MFIQVAYVPALILAIRVLTGNVLASFSERDLFKYPEAKDSINMVKIAAAMATKSVMGKSPHGDSSPRHGLVRLSVASGRMWTKPVAKITPAANAFTNMKKLLSDLRPKIGKQTPNTPATKMEKIAPILYLRIVAFSVAEPPPLEPPHSFSSSVAETRSGRIDKEKMKAETTRGWLLGILN
ncbi:hypothetical protein HID58_095810 [Brassica napus]|uniref:Uncharacterized protein n=1 Tax=Brassica napus TaxID=3708 RepID=A0ABQ7X2A4_BRANA|nr:hypothetical protein HID58_095810 [Brassica napus]